MKSKWHQLVEFKTDDDMQLPSIMMGWPLLKFEDIDVEFVV